MIKNKGISKYLELFKKKYIKNTEKKGCIFKYITTFVLYNMYNTCWID